MTTYGEGCDRCGDPEPGGVWTDGRETLCDACYHERTSAMCSYCTAHNLDREPWPDIEPWRCGGCGELTRETHWRCGADGAMFHAGADAPSADTAPTEDGTA